MSQVRKSYDLRFKKRAIEAFDRLGTISEGALQMMIDRHTLRAWLQQRDQIFAAGGGVMGKRKLHPGSLVKNPAADEDLYQYLTGERAMGRAVTNKALQSKMRELTRDTTFKASNQWMKSTANHDN
jgi:hypothetical protein